MWRLNNERGAVAVLVAILMTALLGFAAIGVDISRMASDKQQLQNGSDAAALAIAEQCSIVGSNCNDNDPALIDAANVLADANKNDGDVLIENVSFQGSTVKVDVADQAKHFFAWVLGAPETTVRASTTVTYGPLTSANGIPLAFSLAYLQCLAEKNGDSFFEDPSVPGGYDLATPPSNVPQAIYLAQFDKPVGKQPTSGCSDSDGNWIPGGFGWLDAITKTNCTASTTVNESYQVVWGSNPGAPPPTACKGNLPLGPVNVPVFTIPPEGAGDGGEYKLDGYVAFNILGWSVPT